jgi:hypothetical protein
MGIALVLAVAAVLLAIGALVEMHIWKSIVEDHARRIDNLERGNRQGKRVEMVD